MRLQAFALVLWLTAVTAGASAADPLSYDDPDVHFSAPDGWQRLDVPQAPADSDGPKPPAAEFTKDFGNGDRRAIVIQIESDDKSLEQLVSDQDSQFRQADGTVILGQERTALANGMTAYWLCADQGTELGHLVRRCEYVVSDGQRSIIVAYLGRQFGFDPKEAKSALSSLSVVYPRRQ
ncbi:MAG: hypothetical protein ACLPYS_19320 [Vulcanimicrobiaceae bacterium]